MSERDGDTTNTNTFLYKGGVPSLNNTGKYQDITTVAVDKGVTFIEDCAFEGFSIHIIQFSNSGNLRRIGGWAFFATLVSSIHLPNLLENIDECAFESCEHLREINLPKTLKGIGSAAFKYCQCLSKITIPPFIVTIEVETFRECTSLSKIIIPASVNHIDECAFFACKNLASIMLPNTIRTIGIGAFQSCKSLQSIQIPQSTTCLGDFSFYSCDSLQIVYVPSITMRVRWTTREARIFGHNSKVIILTDKQNVEYEGHPTFTISDIQECLNALTNYTMTSSKEKLQILQRVLQNKFPAIATRVMQSKLTLLHLLVYFPGDIYQPLLKLLMKLPQNVIAVDKYGKTPFQHVITSTKHNMTSRCYNLLLKYSGYEVVHRAIQSESCWDEIREIVNVKIDALAVEESESGLLPFMLAARGYKGLDLTAVYELLCLKPDVLEMYGDLQ